VLYLFLCNRQAATVSAGAESLATPDDHDSTSGTPRKFWTKLPLSYKSYIALQKLWYMADIYHNCFWYIPRLLCVSIHFSSITKENMKLPPPGHKSDPACTDALRGGGQPVIPSKTCFTEHLYMPGICQVYACYIFQLNASESASAARHFRACRVPSARRDVSDLDFATKKASYSVSDTTP
jgi:hypothetical protein